MNAAVFLDRDNTLIHNDGDLGDPDKVRLIKGAASAVASLQGLGYKVVVVTNQGGVARGKYTEEDVDAVHRRVNELIQANSGAFIDRFYYCPYHPEGSERRYRRDHPWRKPKPGMLIQAGKHLALAMGHSWMVGDQLRDIQAGYAAGVTPILIDPNGDIASKTQAMPPALNGANGGNGDDTQNVEPVTIEPNRDYFVARNLIEAARIIGQKRRPPSSIKPQSERKPSRVVVEEERPPQAESRSKEKVVKKKILRRRKKVKDDTGDIATIEATAKSATKSGTKSAEEAKTSTARRGEAPTRPRRTDDRADDGAPAGHSDIDIDLDLDDDNDALHAPTLTMPSLSPDIDLDDDDDSSADAIADANGRAARPAPASATGSKPATKTPPAQPTTGREPKASPQGETETKARPSRDEAKRSRTAPPESPERTERTERIAKEAPAPASKAASPTDTATSADDIGESDDDSFVSTGNPNVDQTLRQILQELRNQRLTGHEFSYIGVMAIVLQVVAIVCLLAALLMGSGNDQIFSRWIACAVVLQLGTIAMLLFKK